MRMRRQLMSRSFTLRGRLTILCVLGALMPPFALAGPPEKAKTNASKPANDPPLFAPAEFRPEHLATLMVTAPLTAQIGPLSTLSALYAGAHPDAQVWNLRGIFSTKPGRTNVGAASLFLSGFDPAAPLVELAMLQTGDARDCWTLLNTDELRPFPKYFLEEGLIRDRYGIFNGSPEYEAYWQALVLAHYTSAAAFARVARHDVGYSHLFNEPEQHRGQVVHLTGRLIKLLRFDPPDEARGAGVSDLYEGWIMTDDYGENPACIVFTDLPAGWKITGNGRLNVENASFDGYFYKRYRYKAFDSKKANEFRDAPLVIGHTVKGNYVTLAESISSDSWSYDIIWGFLSVLGAAAVGIVVLTLWYRYQDRRIRHRISASRDKGFVPPEESPLDQPEA